MGECTYGTIREHVKNFLHHDFHVSWQYGKDQFGFEIDMGGGVADNANNDQISFVDPLLLPIDEH